MCWKGKDGCYNNENITLKHEKKWKWKYSFFIQTSRFPKWHSFLEGSQAWPFVLLVIATCRRRWMWSISGMILTGENEVMGEKLVLLPVCPSQNWHELTRDRTRAYAVRGRLLTAWTISRLFKPETYSVLYKDSNSTYAVNTPRLSYKNQPTSQCCTVK